MSPSTERRRAADRLFWSGVALVAAVSVGIVFLMATKPDLAASPVTMGGALALGRAVALLSSRPLAMAPGGYPPVVDAMRGSAAAATFRSGRGAAGGPRSVRA